MPKFNQGGTTSTGKAIASNATRPPLIIEQKCLVCKSPHRHLVDQMLVAGHTFSEIERQFEFAGIKRRSIANHKDKHLGYEEAAIRQVIEREAQLAQRNYEDGVERLVTRHAYLEVALQKAYDALIKDELQVEPKDAVKVIEMLTKMQDANQSVAIDEIRMQFQMFLQAVKETVPKEFWEDIVARTQELLKGVGRSVEFGATPEIEAPVDAEVVT